MVSGEGPVTFWPRIAGIYVKTGLLKALGLCTGCGLNTVRLEAKHDASWRSISSLEAGFSVMAFGLTVITSRLWAILAQSL